MDENSWNVRPIWYWSCSCADVEDRETHVCEEQGKIRDLEDWENMVEFWHSIRNNLFHGSKEPNDERDQLLVENGYKTLRALVEVFIEEEKVSLLSLFNAHEMRRFARLWSSESAKPCLTGHGSNSRRPAIDS